MNLSDICRKRAKEIDHEWSDSALFISVADEIESLKAQLAECRDKLIASERAAGCSAEEYEVLRLIQFYALHDPYGDSLIGSLNRLSKIDASKGKKP